MLIFVSAVAVVLTVSFLCSIYESVLLSITRSRKVHNALRAAEERLNQSDDA